MPSAIESLIPSGRGSAPWLDVRAGEGPPVARATLVLFGIIAAHTMLETARDALFLSALPPSRLAWVYGALAVLGLAGAILSTRLVAGLGRPNALVVTLIAAAGGTWLFYLVPETRGSIYCLYLWTGLLGPVLGVQFWLLAGQMFTSAQGKRLFAFVAAGGTLGAVVGAVMAEVLIDLWTLHGLLAVAAAAQLVTAFAVVGIDETAPPFEQVTLPRGRAWLAGLAKVGSHTYLRRIAWMTVLSTVTVLATDYLFKSALARSMPGAMLGPFLARFYALLNAVALFVQLVVAMHVVQRIGTISALAVLPLLLLTDGVLLAFGGGGLAFVLLAKGADGSLRHSLHRVATELLYLPLPPADAADAKPVLDAVVGRATQAVVAAGLFGLAWAGLDTPNVLGIVVGLFGAGWLAATLALRRPYLDLFRRLLGKAHVRQRLAFEDLDVASVAAVQEALSSPDPDHAVAALDVFSGARRADLIPALILYHDAEAVLTRALEVVPSAERRDWPPLAVKLLRHESAAVRTRAVRALARFGHEESLASFEDADPAVRGQLVFAQASADAGDPLEHPRVAEVIAAPAAEKALRVALLEAILEDGDARWSGVLVAMADTDDPDVARLTTLGMASVRDPRFVSTLIRRLAYRDGRGLVRDALVALGEPALDALVETLYAPEVPTRVRLHVPRAIARFGSQRAADLLLDAIRSELPGAVRFKALRGLGSLVQAQPRLSVDSSVLMGEMRRNLEEYLRLFARWRAVHELGAESPAGAARALALVERLLQDKLLQAVDRASRLLQIRHPKENIRGLYSALRSADRRVHANALEFLDALLLPADPADRDLAHVVADALTASERLARATRFVGPPPADGEEALALLVEEPDPTLAALSAHAASVLGLRALEPAVQRAFARYPTFAASLAEAR